MIRIEFNDQPIRNAAKSAQEVVKAIDHRLENVKKVFSEHGVNIAYYSSVIGNFSTIVTGSYWNPTNLLSVIATRVAFDACKCQKKAFLSLDEKKSLQVAERNLVINVIFGCLLEMPTINSVATLYNMMKDHLNVRIVN